jgi:hypothetical protein
VKGAYAVPTTSSSVEAKLTSLTFSEQRPPAEPLRGGRAAQRPAAQPVSKRREETREFEVVCGVVPAGSWLQVS